ncbi:hypothetical protein Celaphus_00010272 [Cervus elaphus hippelaphus]|uniref:Uncharacterized protein n=1 Tax=Cervus elaphus hippelaphus TaxID=46360 RepID=A0A212C9R1_CEREH|nr:hypothetical protein Celaphus_00010272 [Cervus elaphus hippelaphus]
MEPGNWMRSERSELQGQVEKESQEVRGGEMKKIQGSGADVEPVSNSCRLKIEKEEQADPSEEVMEEFQVNGQPQLLDSLLLDARTLGQVPRL